MIERTLGPKVQALARQYPVVTLTGPRQAGKTTLCQMLFSGKLYFSLEDLDIRNQARSDPRAFLEGCVKRGVVLDEIQRVPELVSYIQGLVDREKRPGRFILTGSQNFELLNTITQTLAGRTALATLLPFSFAEIYKGKKEPSIDHILYAGFYPRIHDQKLNPTEALAFYVSTYLERDIRSLINVKDLSKFELFLRLTASRTAQVLNLSSIANDCGINHNTARSWLSVLEASYVIHLVRPHHRNFRKRLVKSPKLYFVDVGLAGYLLDLENKKQLANHPLKGALFETFVVGEFLKARLNAGKRSNLYFFRDNVGNEVDLVLEGGTKVSPVEIKLGATFATDLIKGLLYYRRLNARNTKRSILVYGGSRSFRHSDVEVLSYRDVPWSSLSQIN